MNATQTQTCSHCGEPRAEGQAHDSSRCYTIAHAFVADRGVNGAVPTEADHHIAELGAGFSPGPPTRAVPRPARPARTARRRWTDGLPRHNCPDLAPCSPGKEDSPELETFRRKSCG